MSRRTSRDSTLPKISKDSLNSMSDFRRAEIHSAVQQINNAQEQTKFPTAIAHSNLFKKNAMRLSGAIPGTTGQTDIMGPEVYSPLFQISNMNLPRDKTTMNAWNRIFYDTHPIVRNAINLHASFPISKINIRHKNKKVQQFFEDMADEIDLYNVIYGVALEYWKLGEAFPYAELDRSSGKWKRIVIQNPDYIHVQKSPVSETMLFSLRADSRLQKIVAGTTANDLRLRQSIPSHIIDKVKKGQNIPLDSFNISHLKLLSAPYDIRGTSVIVSVYKDLILYDKIRESKFAQADGMINPMTLVKLGGSNDYRPTQADIEAVRQTLEEAQYDKDFKMITHDGITIERVGYNGGIVETSGDLEQIADNLYTGLMVPKALIVQEGVSYASSSVGLEVLKQRYDIFRNMIKKWLEKKIFAPICHIQDFFEYQDGEKKIMTPTIDFNHMNLYDTNEFISSVSSLVSNQQVSLSTLYRTLGLDQDEENRRIRKELIDRTIYEKEKLALQAYSLSELRSIKDDDEIREKTQTANVGAGDTLAGGLPGMGSDAGLGGLGGAGELPGMGGGDLLSPPPDLGAGGGAGPETGIA